VKVLYPVLPCCRRGRCRCSGLRATEPQHQSLSNRGGLRDRPVGYRASGTGGGQRRRALASARVARNRRWRSPIIQSGLPRMGGGYWRTDQQRRTDAPSSALRHFGGSLRPPRRTCRPRRGIPPAARRPGDHQQPVPNICPSPHPKL